MFGDLCDCCYCLQITSISLCLWYRDLVLEESRASWVNVVGTRVDDCVVCGCGYGYIIGRIEGTIGTLRGECSGTIHITNFRTKVMTNIVVACLISSIICKSTFTCQTITISRSIASCTIRKASHTLTSSYIKILICLTARIICTIPGISGFTN